uniref:Uncharacterized protein n=1 Tax=Candidatus Kentrum sp. FW TaxID=2126338 RepID=A0A450SUU8_9GAMM|nr:MAG: hypothetical protein BECKFW1821A_GA0114235_107412 [Candidatus Kentron sp. FW]
MALRGFETPFNSSLFGKALFPGVFLIRASLSFNPTLQSTALPLGKAQSFGFDVWWGTDGNNGSNVGYTALPLSQWGQLLIYRRVPLSHVNRGR